MKQKDAAILVTFLITSTALTFALLYNPAKNIDLPIKNHITNYKTTPPEETTTTTTESITESFTIIVNNTLTIVPTIIYAQTAYYYSGTITYTIYSDHVEKDGITVSLPEIDQIILLVGDLKHYCTDTTETFSDTFYPEVFLMYNGFTDATLTSIDFCSNIYYVTAQK